MQGKLGSLRKLKASVLIALATALCVGQTANEYETPEVLGIAAKMNCNCGCKLNMACVMPPDGLCPVCKMNRMRIANMLQDGMTEQAILDTYVSEQGKQVLVNPPGLFTFAGPYIALGFGLVIVMFVIQRYRRLKPAPVAAPAGDEELERYHDQIEKDLADME